MKSSLTPAIRRQLATALIPETALWLGVKDFAKIVGRSDRFIYEAIRTEKLIAINFAKTTSERPFYGIHRSDGLDYLAHHGTWLTPAKVQALTNYEAPVFAINKTSA